MNASIGEMPFYIGFCRHPHTPNIQGFNNKLALVNTLQELWILCGKINNRIDTYNCNGYGSFPTNIRKSQIAARAHPTNIESICSQTWTLFRLLGKRIDAPVLHDTRRKYS